MSCKVLHIFDIYLPETMEWLLDSLRLTEDRIEHHIACLYYLHRPIEYKKVKRYGISSSYPIPFWNKVYSRMTHIKYERILMEYVDQQNIDIVHFHFGNMAIKFKRILEKLTCKKLISLYGFDYEYLPTMQPQTIDYYCSLSKSGAQFIVEGNYSKKLLISYGIKDESIIILQMIFKRAESFKFNPWEWPIRLIQVASFTEKKGQLQLLEAIHKSNVADKFCLEMYGEVIDQSYAMELKKYLLKSKLNNCILNNKISKKEYLSKLSRAHIAANLSKHSSNNDSEGGCPVFLKDALALSKPLLTTTHCDIPELAINQYNSWIVPEGDVAGAANKLKEISVLSSAEYYRYARDAYFSAQGKINSNWTRDGFLNVYEK